MNGPVDNKPYYVIYTKIGTFACGNGHLIVKFGASVGVNLNKPIFKNWSTHNWKDIVVFFHLINFIAYFVILKNKERHKFKGYFIDIKAIKWNKLNWLTDYQTNEATNESFKFFVITREIFHWDRCLPTLDAFSLLTKYWFRIGSSFTRSWHRQPCFSNVLMESLLCHFVTVICF